MTGLFAAAVVVAPDASATTANPTPLAGARRSATAVGFPVSGTSGLSVDVGTGNALFTDQLLTLPGVTGNVPISLSYNSSVWGNNAIPSSVDNAGGSGWAITGFDQRLISNADGSVTYYGPAGLSGVFAANGSGGFVTPEQFRATLTFVSGTGYTLLDHTSQTLLTFNTYGRLTKMTDRNSNQTAFAYNGSGYPASITSTRGPSAGRTVTITTTGGRITGLSQTSGTLSRTIGIGWTSLGHLGSITDSVSGVTSFSSGGGDTGQVVVITNPKSSTTTLGFAAGGQVASVAQSNPSTHGGAGTSTTRFTYPTSTQTLVADPTTNQSSSVASVPHTTYTLTSTGSGLVSSAQDPDSNTRSATYVSVNNVASTTPAAGGATAFTYGANSGESLTKAASAAGAAGIAAFTNTGASQYSPSSTTDDASNALNYTYNGQGNQLTSAQGTSGPQAVVTYNTDGTVATSASPGAGTGVTTAYGYNTNHDLTSITPPSGTSLGSRVFTWDGFGRLATATDGRGNTTTYTYDDADRITLIHSSATGLTNVGYTYDALNRVTQRTDASGTTTYTYDDLSNQLTQANTAGGGTITYTYDLARSLATMTDGAGTTSYGYDAAHQLTSMTYPQNGGTNTTYFANDANGRRTDAWLQSNPTHTAWAAHEGFTYDTSGRLKTALGQNGPATAPTSIVNETLCYSAGATAPSCPTTATLDRSNIAWISDTVTGETSKYTYNADDRLTGVAVTGGGNPRTYSYGYDSAGNRTSAAVTGTSPSSQALTFNAANQITNTGYAYDGAGNLTAWPGHSATYNAFEQQTATVTGSVTTTYTYAGSSQNELVAEAIGSGGSSYAYTYGRPDHNGLPQIESVTTSGVTGYIFHDNTGLPVMLQTNSTTTSLYDYDGTGNPTALSTSISTTSYNLRFDPYGAQNRIDTSGSTGGWNENPYVYQGGVQDRATGNIKFGARWYNPTTGTWTQQDNLNRPLDPHNANRYVYAADNPINQSDPTGRCDSILGCVEDFGSSAVDLGTSVINGALSGAAYGAEQGAIIGGAGGCVLADPIGECLDVAAIGAGTGAGIGVVVGAAVGAVGGAISFFDGGPAY